MNRAVSFLRLKRLAWLSIALAVTACAQTVTVQYPTDITPTEQDRLDTDAARQVLWRGYDNIDQRFIDDTSLRMVAVEGMKGLTSIDPAFTIHADAEENILSLAYQDKTVASFYEPDAHNARAWAELTTSVLTLAQRHSPLLRQTTQEGLYKAVFDAALASLDVFSRYASAAEAQENRASRNGFGGIGVQYQLEGGELTITEVYRDTPAGNAGLMPGDRITHIDDVLLQGLNEQDIRHRLRGPIDSDVTLTVASENPETTGPMTLKRALVIPSTVSLRMDNGIATITVSSFNQQTAAAVNEAIDDARANMGSGLLGIALDLRGNPGGLLDQAVAVSDLFLPRGGIVHTRGRHPDASQHYEATEGDPGENLPVVVLIDGHSASAAEIVAAALQDNGRAAVVGSTSFGKGSVQTVVRLPNDGEMTLTWSRFHSPSGYALQDLGVLPSVCTSGLVETASHVTSKALVHGLRSAVNLSAVGANMARWRSIPVNDKQGRASLRRACTPRRSDHNGVDMEMARQLLEDGTLFVRAIGLTYTTAAQNLR